jgi:hypothetical protein
MPRPFIWPLALDPLVAAHDPVGTLGAAVSEVAASAAGTAQANKSSRFHGCARERCRRRRPRGHASGWGLRSGWWFGGET